MILSLVFSFILEKSFVNLNLILQFLFLTHLLVNFLKYLLFLELNRKHFFILIY
jgi:hypothetical protein